MKSQDIVILLKLVSLAAGEKGRGRSIARNWQDWEDESLARVHGSVQRHEVEWEDRTETAPIKRSPDLYEVTQLLPVADSDEATVIPTNEDRASQYSVRGLAVSTGISKSQVSLSLQRCFEVGLAKIDRKQGVPRANTKALGEMIVYGLRYVFPAQLGELTRGIATSLGAPVLEGQIMTAGELVPVWADARGNTKGLAVAPLAPSVPKAVRHDPRLYALLALTDAIRIGQPRERSFATDRLIAMLREDA